jgi:hypothetical protein
VFARLLQRMLRRCRVEEQRKGMLLVDPPAMHPRRLQLCVLHTPAVLH